MVSLKASPQAIKKSPELPEPVEVRLITRIIKGKEVNTLTSMTDLYSHRWEIESGDREMKRENRIYPRAVKHKARQ